MRRSRGKLLAAVGLLVAAPLLGTAVASASEAVASSMRSSTPSVSMESSSEDSWVSLRSEPSARTDELAENPGAASRARLREPAKVASCVAAAGAANGSRTIVARQTIYYPVAEGSFVRSSEYGHRLHPVLGTWKLHAGTDFSAESGTPIFAVADGVVLSAAFDELGGYVTQIRHELEDGSTVVSAYLHQAEGSLLVSEGDTVEAGQQIGAVGTTGISTGAHLHFEIRDLEGETVDPEPWLVAQDAVYIGKDCQ